MRAVIAVLICALAAGAADRDALLEEARKLERRAEVALDQGRRAEAFELLARAAELREQARSLPKPKAKPQAGAKTNPRQEVDRRIEALNLAIEKGDLQAAAKAAKQARNALVAWSRELAMREKELGSGRLARRVEALEDQVRELRRVVDRMR